jgi:hypothetical protein
MTSKKIRRLEIEELLAYAESGEQERVEAGLELLRRRQAKRLRKHSKPKQRAGTEAH